MRIELLELMEDFPRTELVMYPEYHYRRTTGGPEERRRQYEAMAEPLDGERVSGLRELASEAGVWLVPGTVIERGPGGELFNTLVAISPDGECRAAYRKIFPWRPFEPFDPGSEFVTFDLEGLRPRRAVHLLRPVVPGDHPQPRLARGRADSLPHGDLDPDREQELVLARASAIQNRSSCST